jgi:hypothetical protein
MRTDEFVAALARGAGPEKRGVVERRLLIASGVGLAAAIFLVPMLFGFRSDLGNSLLVVLLKAGFALIGVAAAAPLLVELARPNARIKHVLTPAALFAVASVALAAAAYIITPPEARMYAWFGDGVPECLYRIPLLAIPVAVALTFAVRGLGATRLTLAGAAIGAVSGAIAAIAYASCCPMDSALYVASWYLTAILFCAGVGALVIARALRW